MTQYSVASQTPRLMETGSTHVRQHLAFKHRPLAGWILMAAGALALQGCAIFRPYIRADSMTCSASKPAMNAPCSAEETDAHDQAGQENDSRSRFGNHASTKPKNFAQLSANVNGNGYVGGAESALRSLNDQIKAYNDGMNDYYSLKMLTGAATIGIGAHALYLELARGSSNSTLPRSTASDIAWGSATYGMGVWLSNDSAAPAYGTGIQALACTALHAEGLLMRHREYVDFADDVDGLRAGKAEVERLAANLSHDIDLSAEGQLGLSVEEVADIKRDLRAAYAAAGKAAKLHEYGVSYLNNVSHAGEQIRASVDLVAQQVDAAIKSPDISKLSGIIGSDPSKVLQSLQGIPVTAEPTPANGGSSDTGKLAPTPQANTAFAAQNKPLSSGVQALTPLTAKEREHLNEQRIKLRHEVDDLYLAMNFNVRPVLARAHKLYQSNLQIQACGGDSHPLTISPSDTQTATAGDSVVWKVTGGNGYPTASIVGNTGKSKPTLTSENIAGATQFTLKVPDDAPESLLVSFTDQKTTLTETVEVTAAKVPAPLKVTPKDVVGGATLSFATPTKTGTTLKSYALTITPASAKASTLTFSDANQGTKATGGGSLTGTITATDASQTTLTLGGLKGGTKYGVVVKATFGDGSEVSSESIDVTPTAVKKASPRKKNTGNDKAASPAKTVDSSTTGSESPKPKTK